MTPEPALFRDLAYVFTAAVLGGALAWATRQPLVLGYVVGGIAISPFTPGPAVSDVKTFEAFAEIGVVLLMFSIGIEFSLKDLLRDGPLPPARLASLSLHGGLDVLVELGDGDTPSRSRSAFPRSPSRT